MKLCNAEIMKKIKLLEQDKQEITDQEERVCETTYQSDADKIETGYSFSETRGKVTEIDSEIRKLKHLLNYSNATTKVEDFDMSLGECLVYMAQLNSEKNILDQFMRREPKTRHSTMNGVVQYTIINYDKDECKERQTTVKETIAKLQIAIDRINLTNLIDVE